MGSIYEIYVRTFLIGLWVFFIFGVGFGELYDNNNYNNRVRSTTNNGWGGASTTTTSTVRSTILYILLLSDMYNNINPP